MNNWTRREFLKTGIAASTGASSFLPVAGSLAFAQNNSPATLQETGASTSPRERLLLDFGWRFHAGHAQDPSLDFNYGREREYAKTGDFFLRQSDSHPRRPGPSSLAFDDADWQAMDLPHDWAVELPFQEDRWLTEHGSKPLGRTYPATSIGWYRRVFDIPQSDVGKRLSIEFDGVFRDSMVALNGNFLGR
ncbi:MAG: beta-galactosidase, partial [Terriglobia bacterium]